MAVVVPAITEFVVKIILLVRFFVPLNLLPIKIAQVELIAQAMLIVAFRHQSLREALLQLLPVYLVLQALFAREQVVIVLPRLQEELLTVHRVLLVLIGIVLTIPAV